MDRTEIKILGAPCGRHGPYTFHKAFSTTTLVRDNDNAERTSNSVNLINNSTNVNNSSDNNKTINDSVLINSNKVPSDNNSSAGDDDHGYRKQTRVVAISDFCVVRPWSDSALLCVAELQLLWTEHRSAGVAGGDRTLASLRLYVEPASAPELNSLAVFGEDEVLAISEKVVLRLEDLVTWMTAAEDVPWTRGLQAVWYRHGAGGHPKYLFDSQFKDTVDKVEDTKNFSADYYKAEDLDKGLIKTEYALPCDYNKDQEQYVDKVDSLRMQNEDVKTRLGEMYEVKDFKDFKGKRNVMLSHSKLELADVDKEKETLSDPPEMPEHQESSSRVVVLSYSRYCRHRALAKRLESNIRKQESIKIENVCTKMENIKLEPSDQQNTASFNSQLNSVTEPERINQVNKALADSLIMSPEMQDALIQALGGYVADVKNTRILFCRETFSYPDLETHEMLCNHLAPKLKGRPRGRRKKQILPIFNSTRKRQLLAINSDKNKGRKSQHDDDEERRMLQMLAGLSDSGGEISADSDDLGSEHMPCAATVARMTTGGGRQGLRCNSRKTLKNPTITSINTVNRKRKQSDNSFIDNLNNTDDDDSNGSELSPELEQKAREDFEQRLRDFNRDAMMDGYTSEKNTSSGGGLQGVTNNITGAKMTALMGDGKKLDMYMFYSSVQKLGGYDSVTASRQWRGIFDDLVARQEVKADEGKQDADMDKKTVDDDKDKDKDKDMDVCKEDIKTSPAPNAASATVTRRHYEKSLLAFERFEQANNSSLSRSMEQCRDPLAFDQKDMLNENILNSSILSNKSAKQKLPKKPQPTIKNKDKPQIGAKKKYKSTSDTKSEDKVVVVASSVVNNEAKENLVPKPQVEVTNVVTTTTNQCSTTITTTSTTVQTSAASNIPPLVTNTILNTNTSLNQLKQLSTVHAVQPVMAQFNSVNNGTQPRTPTSSSLRSVRVKPDRVKQGQNACSASPGTSPGINVSPPVVVKPVVPVCATNIQNTNPVAPTNQHPTHDSDDNDVIEVAYKPATPEVIDLVDDEDEPSSGPNKNLPSKCINNVPQVFTNPSPKGKYTDVPSSYSAKRSKLEMLQQAGLEVTPVRQHMLMQQQQQLASTTPPIPFNTQQFGFRSPAQQKTVYGNPRDVLGRFNGNNKAALCLSVRQQQGVQDLSITPQSALDLSAKQERPNRSTNLEITLVPKPGRPPKRTLNTNIHTKPSDLVIPRYQPQREVALDRSNSVSISLEKPKQPIASKPVANVPPYFVEPPHNKAELMHEPKHQPQPLQQPNTNNYLQYFDPVFLSALCAATAQQQHNSQTHQQQQQAMLAAMFAAGLPLSPATPEAMHLYGLLGLRLPSSQQHK